jgi:hypothetical protein
MSARNERARGGEKREKTTENKGLDDTQECQCGMYTLNIAKGKSKANPFTYTDQTCTYTYHLLMHPRYYGILFVVRGRKAKE